MEEIIIKKQKEFNNLPDIYSEKVYIKIKGNININKAIQKAIIIVKDNYYVRLYNNAHALLFDNSQAELMDNSTATLHDNSKARAHDNSKIKLYDASRAILLGNSQAELYGNSQAELYEKSQAKLFLNSQATLHEKSQAKLFNDSQAKLYGISKAKLYDNSKSILYHNSTAILYDDAQADLFDNSQAILYMRSIAIIKSKQVIAKKHHFAKIIKNFKKITPKMYCETLEKTKDGRYVLYKSVNPDTNCDFYTGKIKYEIGKIVKPERWNPDPNIQCGDGLHLCPTPEMALRYNKGKILKCAVRPEDIIIYQNDLTKVRCREVEVIGEYKEN